MKTRTLYLVPLAFVLIAAMTVGFIFMQQATLQKAKSQPIFWAEEITITKPMVKAVPQVKAVPKVVAKTVPVPQPKVAAPLPIVPPSVSSRVLPQYPASALEGGLQGTVIVAALIGANGKPGKVEVRSSSGVAELDQSAIAAVSQWIFVPASQGVQAVASWFEIPIRFEVK
jgi:protein TonB